MGRASPDEEEILRWGSYVGEAAVRAASGQWCRDTAFSGVGGYAVKYPGAVIYPLRWVHVLLQGNKDEGSLETKFGLLVLRDSPQFWKLEKIASFDLQGEHDSDRLSSMMERLSAAGVVPQVDILAPEDPAEPPTAVLNVKAEQVELARRILSDSTGPQSPNRDR